ncbi:MAG TPA: PadR family transcriptional regulator [Solirubrobacteraceae bacterium]|nr:PadR family transcriptional regulator [Solirubrobacteraceae bacterium]
MSAKHALLGLLLHRPAYRYQLGDRLQERLGPAWKINSGQLYQTIERLEDDGLIERVDAVGDGQPERDVFTVTTTGIEEFERWFEGSLSRARLLRRPLLVKITLAGPARLRATLKEVDSYEHDCAACLRDHLRLRDTIPLGGLRVRADHELLRLNLTADIMQLEAELGWVRHARERIAWLLDQDAIWPVPQRRSGSASDPRGPCIGDLAAKRHGTRANSRAGSSFGMGAH